MKGKGLDERRSMGWKEKDVMKGEVYYERRRIEWKEKGRIKEKDRMKGEG